MRFKLDENIPLRVADLLTNEFHEVSTVKDEGLVGEPDEVVARAATDEDRMLITLDKDFGDLRSFPPGTHPGIIVMRLTDQSAPSVTRVLKSLLSEFDFDNLSRCITIVEENRVRIRTP